MRGNNLVLGVDIGTIMDPSCNISSFCDINSAAVMEKLFFYDLETTGLDENKHAIHQLSGKIVIPETGVQEPFDFRLSPWEGAELDAKALEAGGVSAEQIMSYPRFSIAYFELIKIMNKYVDRYDKRDKFHLVGYNISSFDNRFFRKFFDMNLDQYFGSWFWSDPIDVFVLASNYFRRKRPTFENFKQSTVAKRLGIEIDETKLHEASYDIDVCEKIFNIVSRIPSSPGMVTQAVEASLYSAANGGLTEIVVKDMAQSLISKIIK